GAGLSIVTERGRGYRLDARNAVDRTRAAGAAEPTPTTHNTASTP
ncbi:MAG: DNA-binding response regulator, partial [Leifsonia sp.]|nr:DNA-binding response regulator [Leifsonia sp.]